MFLPRRISSHSLLVSLFSIFFSSCARRAAVLLVFKMTCDKAPSVWDVATGRSDARNVFRQRIRLGEVGPPFLPTLRVRALYNFPRLLYSFLGESATSSRCVVNEYGDGGSRQSSRSSRTFTTRPFSRVSTRAGLRLSSSTQWGRTAAALDQSGERRRDDVHPHSASPRHLVPSSAIVALCFHVENPTTFRRCSPL